MECLWHALKPVVIFSIARLVQFQRRFVVGAINLGLKKICCVELKASGLELCVAMAKPQSEPASPREGQANTSLGIGLNFQRPHLVVDGFRLLGILKRVKFILSFIFCVFIDEPQLVSISRQKSLLFVQGPYWEPMLAQPLISDIQINILVVQEYCKEECFRRDSWVWNAASSDFGAVRIVLRLR